MKDILDQLTDKTKLEGLVEASKSAKKRTIDADALKEKLKAKIFGQNNVCDDVAQQIRIRFAKSIRNKPIGVFMFAGPPATGKTWFAKVLSDELYGENSVKMIEMAHYDQPHTAATLFGQTRGYAGSDKSGVLTGTLKAKPDQVILLDEFEKAHDSIHKRFLNAWNDGKLTDQSTDEIISTTDAIFILTTNAKQREIAALAVQYEGDPEGYAAAAKRELEDAFAPEVLSRIDRVFPFMPLEGMDTARIVAGLLQTQVKEYAVELEHIEAEALFHIIEDVIQTGADPREIARKIETKISGQIVDLADQGVKNIRIDIDEENIQVLAV